MIRLDRLITLYGARPLMRLTGAVQQFRIPILMYHSISNHDENDGHPYYNTITAPSVFNDHMKYLSEHGYSSISIDEALNLLSATQYSKDRTISLDKYVVITFDDGFRDFYTTAFPILEKYKFGATVYLATDYISKNIKFKNKECLSWDETRELDRHGIVFGSHTVTHPILTKLPFEEIESEIKHSKEEIENRLGKAVFSFAYPYAFPEENREFKTLLTTSLKKYGYDHGVCTTIGTITIKRKDKYMLSRIPMNSFDDAVLLKAKLEGCYDWIRISQHILKNLKSKSWVAAKPE